MGILIDFIKSPKMLFIGLVFILLAIVGWQYHTNSVLKVNNIYLKEQVTSVTAQFNKYKKDTENANQIAAEAEAKKNEATKAANETKNIINQALTLNQCFASAAPNTVVDQLRQLATSASDGK